MLQNRVQAVPYTAAMKRWSNQPLARAPRIALVANDAIGNYVIATSLAVMLRDRFAGARIELWSGDRVRDFVDRGSVFDAAYEFLRRDDAHIAAEIARAHGAANGRAYDLVVNIEDSAQARQLPRRLVALETFVCGPAEEADGSALPWPTDDRGRLWAHREWIATDIAAQFPWLRSGYIGEFFCRLAYLDGPIPQAKVSREPWTGAQPDILIAMSASLPDKLWSVSAWRDALSALRADGFTVGLIGAAPTAQKSHWLGSDAEDMVVTEGLALDMRGQLRLPQVVDCMTRAKAVLTLDNGIMHLAATTDTPVVALFRHGIHRLWKPSWGRVDAIVANAGAAVETIAREPVLAAMRKALACAPARV
ncbi:MAG: hypothetical protein RIS45_100 [Planctomycetota bacterium]